METFQLRATVSSDAFPSHFNRYFPAKARAATNGNSYETRESFIFLPEIGITPMHIELWDVSRIRPYDKNPRINDQAVEAVMASNREFGFRQTDCGGYRGGDHRRAHPVQGGRPP